MQKYSSIFFLSFLITACVKDKPNSSQQPQVQLSTSKKVYIINEGIFPYGNASISLFDPGTNEVLEDFYKVQNSSVVGDVAQSLSFINAKYYIVVNNSNKIIECNDQFKKTGQINGLQSPRYILPVTNQKAYVSDLYANAISIVNLNTRLKTGAIPCNGKTEQMVLIYNKAFVTNTESKYVYVINTTEDRINDSIFVGQGASSLVIDKEDRVWVLATGEATKQRGRLSKINALSNQIEFFKEFDLSDSPGYLCINRTKDSLFYINNGICRIGIADSNLPVEPMVRRGNKNFYGLGIHPNNYSIYASDALDYSQRSNIYVFDQNGNQINTFKAGINANGFYFE